MRINSKAIGALAAAAAAIAIAAVLLVTVLLVVGNRDDDDSATPAPDDLGVAHVHGLGVDPADGTLYVATHHGTFRVPDEGQAQRAGDDFQDTMGFTIAGDRHFLGSGHPDVAGMREGQPSQLGLIESTDAGETWQPVSLSGEVDFHGLAYTHDQVYGWDAATARFMVSADQHEWDTRSTIDLYSFAVDPNDPDHVIGATPRGIVASTDGGRQWTATDGPPVAVLAWDATSGVWGVDPDGSVHHSTDGGATWDDSGSLPGPPQALLATPETLYAAADEGGTTGIYQSIDDGQTWTLRYRDGQ